LQVWLPFNGIWRRWGMNNLFDILEVCLQELENGVELEKVLESYPDMAAELRPLLQAALTAKLAAIPVPAPGILNRNQAKVFQRFDQVRDAKPATTSWFPSLQWVSVAFVLLIMFFVSGTSLVRASFNSLPGDSLYPVKRSWENATLFFTFDTYAREKLELEYEDERLKELDQLFASGRTAQVEFAGVVIRQQGEEWWVANVLVIVSAQTDLPEQTIKSGDSVYVFGVTRGDGFVLADRIELLATGAVLPDLNDGQPEIATQQPSATSEPNNGNENLGTETETSETKTPLLTSTPEIENIEGVLISINQNIWKVDAVLVNVGNAETIGIPAIGVGVKAEGYFGLDGIFVAMKIEIVNTGSNDNNANSNSGDGNTNNNTNSNGGNDNSNGGGNDNGGGSGNGGNDNNDSGGGHGGG